MEEYEYANLDKSRQTWYRSKLKMFNEWCEQKHIELQDIKAKHIREYVDYRRKQFSEYSGQPLSKYTLRSDIQVIKGFLRWCSKEDGLEDFVSDRVVTDVKLPGVDEKVIETFTLQHAMALLAACKNERNENLAKRDTPLYRFCLVQGFAQVNLLS